MTTLWTDMIDAWATYLRASGAPESTIGQRLYHLRRLASEIDGGPALTFDVLVTWLAAHNWAPNTRRSYRASLRAFYGWALADGRVSTSPAHLLPPVRVPRGKPRPTPEVAYRAALQIADDRARLAIMLAARCGLRRGEIARSCRADVEANLLGHDLRVRGKGGHERMVPLPDDLAGTILTRPDGWLFPSSHGGHLTPHHLGKIVSRCLAGDLTTHTLRHRCATTAYAATHDLRAVQELLGHMKPETTALYTQVPDAAVRTAMEAAAA
jgi:integrase/recombinase XerC